MCACVCNTGPTGRWTDSDYQLLAMAIAPELFTPSRADAALRLAERRLLGFSQVAASHPCGIGRVCAMRTVCMHAVKQATIFLSITRVKKLCALCNRCFSWA